MNPVADSSAEVNQESVFNSFLGLGEEVLDLNRGDWFTDSLVLLSLHI